MASDGETRAEEVGVFGWVPWFEAGEGGKEDRNGRWRPLKQTLTFGRWRLRHEHRFRCKVLVSVRGLKNRRSFAKRETGHGVPRRNEVKNSGRLCSI